MSIMRDIGRQIGHQKTAIRLPGMKAPRNQSMGAMTLKMPSKTGPRGPGAASATAPQTATRPTPGAPSGGPDPTLTRSGLQPGGAAQQGLMGLLKSPGVRNAAGTVGRASKIGVPGGILLNRLIAAMAGQNQMEGNVNQSIGNR